MKRFKEIGERERDKGKNEKGRVLGRVTALFMPITLSIWMTKIHFFTLPFLPLGTHCWWPPESRAQVNPAK